MRLAARQRSTTTTSSQRRQRLGANNSILLTSPLTSHPPTRRPTLMPTRRNQQQQQRHRRPRRSTTTPTRTGPATRRHAARPWPSTTPWWIDLRGEQVSSTRRRWPQRRTYHRRRRPRHFEVRPPPRRRLSRCYLSSSSRSRAASCARMASADCDWSRPTSTITRWCNRSPLHRHPASPSTSLPPPSETPSPYVLFTDTVVGLLDFHFRFYQRDAMLARY